MEHIEAKLRWSDEQFKRRIGTTKDIFRTMLCILQDAYDKGYVLGDSPPKISVDERLLIALYRTMEHIGTDFDCYKYIVFRAIRLGRSRRAVLMILSYAKRRCFNY